MPCSTSRCEPGTGNGLLLCGYINYKIHFAKVRPASCSEILVFPCSHTFGQGPTSIRWFPGPFPEPPEHHSPPGGAPPKPPEPWRSSSCVKRSPSKKRATTSTAKAVGGGVGVGWGEDGFHLGGGLGLLGNQTWAAFFLVFPAMETTGRGYPQQTCMLIYLVLDLATSNDVVFAPKHQVCKQQLLW